MSDLPEIVRWGAAAAAVLLLFAFAWVSTGPMPRLARALARVCLLTLAVLPFALLVTFSDRELPWPGVAGSAPPEIVVGAPAEPESEPEPEGRAAPAPKDDEPVLERVEPEAPTSVKPPPKTAEPPAPTDPGKVIEESPPAAGSAPPPPAEPGRGLGGETATGIPPPPPPPAPPAAAPEPAKEAFEVVPVYYGTDRGEGEAGKRLDYAATRGRKLTLGRALVTVPKAHIKPAIERPWTIRIPYLNITLYEEAEDPEKHFTMQELKNLSREEFLTVVRERLAKSERFKDHALVFVHGFNTTFDNGVYRTAQIAYDLKFDGAPFLYSWPSGGGVASYTYDRESAGQAVPFMREFLELVIKETGAKSVSVIAHSMGNQPTLQVLKDIKASSPPGVLINQIILAAPDVDRDNFENIAREISGLANGITLYAAANDRALGVSRRFNGGVPRAGDVPDAGPIVTPGVDTIDVTAVSTDSLGLNHSGYAENNALLNDVQLLIQTGERPPEKRVPILEKVGTASGDYWRYPKTP